MADNPIIITSLWKCLLADGADNYAFYSPVEKAIVKAIYYKSEPGPDPVPDDYTISGGDFEITTDTRTLIKAEWSAELSKLPDAGKNVTVVIYNPQGNPDNTWLYGTTTDVFNSIVAATDFATITSTDTIGTIVKEADAGALSIIAAFLSTGGTLCMGCIQKSVSATSETWFPISNMTLTLTFADSSIVVTEITKNLGDTDWGYVSHIIPGGEPEKITLGNLIASNNEILGEPYTVQVIAADFTITRTIRHLLSATLSMTINTVPDNGFPATLRGNLPLIFSESYVPEYSVDQIANGVPNGDVIATIGYSGGTGLKTYDITGDTLTYLANTINLINEGSTTTVMFGIHMNSNDSASKVILTRSAGMKLVLIFAGLGVPVALEATNITPTGFTANWVSGG